MKRAFVRFFVQAVAIATFPVLAASLPYSCNFENGVTGWTTVGAAWAGSGGHSGTMVVKFTPDSDAPQYIIAPSFSGSTAMTVSFYYYGYVDTGRGASLRVGHSSTTSDYASFTWGEWIPVEEALVWTQYMTTVPVGTRFIAVGYKYDVKGTVYGVVYIDDFLVEEHFSYEAPSGLTTGEVTDHGATFSWTSPNASVTGFAYQVKTEDAAAWSDATSVSGTSATLDGLSANTDYLFRVRAVYPGGHVSDWTLPVSFTTEGASIIPPCEEGFENGLGGWRVVNGDEFNQTGIQSGTTHIGGHAFRFARNTLSTSPVFLVSPRIESSTPSTLSFWYTSHFESGTDCPTYFQPGISTTTKDVSAFIWGRPTLASRGIWKKMTIDLPSNTRYVAFKWHNDNFALYLDDFRFEKAVVFADDADNGQTIADFRGQPVSATLQGRSFSRINGDWWTLTLPFAVTDFKGTPLEGATVQTLVSASCVDSRLTMDFADVDHIEAGMPYVVRWTNTIARVIRTLDDWNAFADAVHGGNSFKGQTVVLDADIGSYENPVEKTVGEFTRSFGGTFDGRGHQLYVWINTWTGGYEWDAGVCVAPFGCINNATICNVRVIGLVAGGNLTSGLVGQAFGGTNLICNCMVNAHLYFIDNAGVFLGYGRNSNTTIRDCYARQVLFTSAHENEGAAGMIYGVGGISEGETNGVHVIENCLAEMRRNWHDRVPSHDMMLAGEGERHILNCYKFDDVGTQGTYVNPDASGALEECRQLLGSQWYLDAGGQLSLKNYSTGTLSNEDVKNPAFNHVFVRDTVQDVATANVDFVGNTSPVEVAGGDRTTLFIDSEGRLSWASTNTTVNSCRARIRLKGLSAGNTVTKYVVHLGGETVKGVFTNAENVDIGLEHDDSNDQAIAGNANRMANVTLRGRTLRRDGSWTTLTLPFDLPSLDYTPLQGATVKSLVSSSLDDGTLTMRFEGATGIEAGRPYVVRWPGPDLCIDTTRGWNAFAESVAAGNTYEGKVVLLNANVVVSNAVGTAEHPFRGLFEGSGNTLFLEIGDGGVGAAPFRYVRDATIQNVKTEGSVSGDAFTAGLVGIAAGTNVIHDCWVNASVSGGSPAAGFLGNGASSKTTIRNCLFDGTVSALTVGVFQGAGESGGSFLLENCWTLGSYSGTTIDLLLAGGGEGSVVNCYKSRNVGSQGAYYLASGASAVRATLGAQWSASGTQIQLTPTDCAAAVLPPVENPRFFDVTIRTATASDETACADFVGNMSPVEILAGDRTTLQLHDDGTFFWPLSDGTFGSCRARFLLKGLEAGREVERFVLDFGDRALSGDFAYEGNEIFDLVDDADNTRAISLALGKKSDVTLRGRVFNRSDSWNALTLPFDVPGFLDTPLDGATVWTLTSSMFDGGTLTAAFTNVTSIQAGRPYLVKWVYNCADLEIGTVDQWNAFAARVAGGETFAGWTVKLVGDLAVSTMVGTAEHPFCGTFDGGGHTLDVNLFGGEEVAAPFRYVRGATIRDVKTAGTISGGAFSAGLAGIALGGANVFRDCWVDASVSGASRAGGFLGNGVSSRTVFRNCLFTGSLSASSQGVFQGWGEAGGTFAARNCVAYGSYSYTTAFDLLLAGGGECVVDDNCIRNRSAGSQGLFYPIISGNSHVAAILGEHWIASQNDELRLAPPSNLANVVNPVFRNVTVSASTANVETVRADLVGNTSPVALSGGDRTALFLEGAFGYPGSSTVLNSCRAYLRLKGVDAVRCVMDFGGKTNSFDEITALYGSGYDYWLTANSGVAGAWDAMDSHGIYNVFRYAFNKPSGEFDDPPLLSISIEEGQVVVHTPLLVNTEGFTFSIVATDSLDGKGTPATYPLNASGRTEIPASPAPARFFRLRATKD